jgi:hypothetical protein
MEFNFKSGKISQDFDGNINITLEVSKEEKPILEPLNELLNDEKLKTCTIKHYRKKRSLNANNYAWAIIGKIADVLRVSKEEVYLMMLKRYGQSVVVSVQDEAVKAFINSVKYAEVFAHGVINDKTFSHIKVYIGSSEYDTRQMSIFIDGIVQEASELKIPTITQRELEKLKSNWQFNTNS